MGQKPSVDAVHVEGVAAFGEQSELVVGLEFAEANRAIKWVQFEADYGLVEEHREGVDEGLVDAGVVEVEELLELALEGRRAAAATAAGIFGLCSGLGVEEESEEEVEEAGEEEDDGEDDEGQENAWTYFAI